MDTDATRAAGTALESLKPVVGEAVAAILASLGNNLGALVAMLAEDHFDAEFLRPTPAASALTRELLVGAAQGSSTPLPEVDIGPTGDGGLTAQWGRQDASYVRLLVPADPSQAYIYSRAPGLKRVSAATTAHLVHELTWLEAEG